MNLKRKVISCLMSAVFITGTVIPASAVQSGGSDYIDPADNWLSTSSRASEFDANAVKTTESSYCWNCEQDTMFDLFRVPEYASVSAAERGIMYTDGSNGYSFDEANLMPAYEGYISDPTPSKGSTYTGFHWSKAVCQKCHLFNTNQGVSKVMSDGGKSGSVNPAVGQNWYILYPCDQSFFHHFTDNEYLSFDETTHTVAKKEGDYCQFCHGTTAERQEPVTELHSYVFTASPEEGNHRFRVNAECDVCGYDYDRYITAKSVIADYIGEADGEPHTVNVTDYSENPVITSIKYGDSPDNITSNTAPNFVDEGAYDAWYKITYTAGEANTTAVASFDEIGNAKVMLSKKNERKAPSATLNGGDVIITNEDGTSVVVHTHNYEYKYTVSPTSTALGYEIWQCDGCGETEQRNFVAQTGEDTHNFVYKYTVDPTCISDGYEIWQCANCGSIQRQNYKSKSNHKYVYQSTVPATCTGVGYEIWQCADCGMTDKRSYTNAAGHNYEKTEIREASCAQTGF